MSKPLGLEGVSGQVTSSQNLQQDKQASTANKSASPSDEQDRIRYGIITDISDSNLVKVKLLGDQGTAVGKDIVNGAFLPLITPLSQIHLLWGMLRKGLICRIFWRGKLDPNATSAIEIIADESHNFLAKETQSNEISTSPYKIFSGGVGV